MSSLEINGPYYRMIRVKQVMQQLLNQGKTEEASAYKVDFKKALDGYNEFVEIETESQVKPIKANRDAARAWDSVSR